MGEIPVSLCSKCKINVCQICEQGTYSLETDFSKNAIECLNCDYNVAKSCYKNIIMLKPGFWRKNIYTDEILACDAEDDLCNGDESKSYCIEGHAGLIC